METIKQEAKTFLTRYIHLVDKIEKISKQEWISQVNSMIDSNPYGFYCTLYCVKNKLEFL